MNLFKQLFQKCEGTIKYSKIDFCYPIRPEVQVLDELDLHVRSGTTIALVGSSGCGKSTCIQLIQRLYDPNSGTVVSYPLLGLKIR